jgi:excisionase family DNA binding protein
MAMTDTSVGLLLDVIAPTGGDAEAARTAAATLARALRDVPPGDATLHFAARDGSEVALPVAAARMLLTGLEEMARGHAVALTGPQRELSTTEAAELLGVSRTHVVKLLDAGLIPHRMVGSHRRIRLGDVLAHKRRQERRHAAVDELAAEAQAMGLYD